MNFVKILTITILASGTNAQFRPPGGNPAKPLSYDQPGDFESDIYESNDDGINSQNIEDKLESPFSYNIKETSLETRRDKKSQTLCRVKKIQKYHIEAGYEFHPKQYNEYECLPYDGDLNDGSSYNLDVCVVNGSYCKTLKKTLVFGKRKENSQCLGTHEKTIKVGCDCINHVKFQFS